MYRQGDILLRPIRELPHNVRQVARDPRDRVVLAYGEQTGHAHCLTSADVALYSATDNDGSTFLEVTGGDGAELHHEEHGPIKLPAGVYRVIRQREYLPEAIRPVAD
jgi:hypothetical protein